MAKEEKAKLTETLLLEEECVEENLVEVYKEANEAERKQERLQRLHLLILIVALLAIVLGLNFGLEGSKQVGNRLEQASTFNVPNGVETIVPTSPKVGGSPFPQPIHRLAERLQASGQDGLIHIEERYFATQMTDVYLNKADYLGKRFQLEGFYKAHALKGKVYHFVMRYGPACCAFDQTVGFEMRYNGDWPQEMDWLVVTGTLKQYEEDGRPYLYLEVDQLEKKDERGLETVVR